MSDDSERAPLDGAASVHFEAARDALAEGEGDARSEALVRERLLGDVAPVKIGRFTVLRVLGSGASSVVYAAYDDQLDRKIALKVLGAALPAVADERLRREAQALARLAHPNVVAIHETGVWEGRRFLAMELVEGQPLSEWLRERPHDARLVAAAQRLTESDPTSAAIALREVRYPDKAAGWRATASGVLFLPMSRAHLRTPGGQSFPSRMSLDGAYVLTPLANGDVLRWRADGTGRVSRVRGNPAFESRVSADGEWVIVATATQLRLSRVDGSAAYVIGGASDQGAFVGASTDVVTVSATGQLRRWRSGSATEQPWVLPRSAPWTPSTPWHLGGAGIMLYYLRRDGWWHWPLDGSRLPRRHVARDERFRLIGTSPSERKAWVGLEGGDLKVLDLTAAVPPRILRGHAKTVVSAAFGPAESWLASGSYDGTARVWSLETAAPPLVLRGHTDAVGTAKISPDGTRLVTSSYDRTARLWSLDGRGQLQILRGHRHQLVDASFGPDGAFVITTGIEPSVRVWDLRDPPVRLVGRHDGAIWSAAIDPSGARLVTGGVDGTARIWSLEKVVEPKVLRGTPGTTVYSVVFSPDAQWVASGSSDGLARLWRADDGALVRTLERHAQWVYGLAFSPDGGSLATGAKEGEVRLTNVLGASPPRSLVPTCATRDGAWVEELIFSARGDRLLSNGYGCQHAPAILDVEGTRAPLPFVLGSKPRSRLALSSRQLIALGGDEGTVSLWTLDGKKVTDLRGHDAMIHHLAFSRAGNKLVSSSIDGSARIWDVDAPGDPIILRGHEDWVVYASFDGTGRRVVTASYDGTARVWSLDEPDQPIALRGHEGGLRFAAFTPRGQVVTASRDGSVRLWDLAAIGTDVESLMRRLRQATTDCLTADQRMQYLDERIAEADARFAACERAAGRWPAPLRGALGAR